IRQFSHFKQYQLCAVVLGTGSKASRGGQDELGMRVLGAAAISAVVLLYLAADLVGNRPINDHCPVTGEVVSQAAPTVAYQGYRVALASEAAASEWQRWDGPRRTDFLTGLGARPGWLARFGPHLRAAVIAVVGALWIWFAGVIIAQCTGMTDWSPISGMALLTVVLVLMLAGTGAVVGAVLIGAALCVAITLAADMMQDLKTGFLVGAQPKRQQMIELMVVGIGPVICMTTLMLIVATNRQETGLPLGPGTATVAPQAQALQAVIVGVQGGELPYALYAMGGIMGMVLGAGAFSGLGVLIGLSMYLPFHYIATYGIGCVAHMWVARIRGRTWAEEWGVPFCAGLIVGESTLALVINMFILMRGGSG
ncbi:MAG: OPT/YSL family transporter, partial [Pirellulales bacterium]